MLAWLLRFQFRNVCFEAQLHTDCFSPYFRSESFKNYLRYLSYRFTLRCADRVRVVSPRLKEGLLGWGVSAEKIYVLPIFVDVEKIKNTPATFDLHQKYPQFEKIILMVSRLSREKNIALALEALAEVLKTRPKVGLIIVGDGPERAKLELQTTDYRLRTNVIFEGWQSDTISYYKTADVFLNTSFYEGYGMSIIEAIYAGAYVISTDVGIVPEIGVAQIPFDPIGASSVLEKSLSTSSEKSSITVSMMTKREFLSNMKEMWQNLDFNRTS
jgi:glycosyltransferase involved in cell wall biosynthesis